MADGKAANVSANANGAPAAPIKTAKGKKNAISHDKGEILRQKIAQLEQTEAADQEQENEIQREVKKASKELSNSISGFDNLAKINRLQKEYSDLLGKLKRQERELKNAKRRAELLSKERDAAKADASSTRSMKNKLESLSRNAIEDKKRVEAELARMQREDSQFQNEMRHRLDHSTTIFDRLLCDHEQSLDNGETFMSDEQFKNRAKSFVEQYELREQHFKSQLRVKELEIQHHIAKFEQQRRAQEVESSRSNQLTRQVSTFSQTETELRSQLNIYVEKFKQVEDTLNSSNDLFLTFRKEMEEMSKKTKRLEKENLALTRKTEATNASILKMAEERTRSAKEHELLRRKNENLEKLCRGMQAQGRGQQPIPHPAAEAQAGLDEDGMESEYDDDYDDEDASLDDDEYDDEDQEAEIIHDISPVIAKQIVFGPTGTSQPAGKAAVKA